MTDVRDLVVEARCETPAADDDSDSTDALFFETCNSMSLAGGPNDSGAELAKSGNESGSFSAASITARKQAVDRTANVRVDAERVTNRTSLFPK